MKLLTLLAACSLTYLYHAYAEEIVQNKKIVDFNYEDSTSIKFLENIHDSQYMLIQALSPLTKERLVEIGTFKYDLNGDGKEELFIYYNSFLACGSKGCTTKIIDFSGKKPMEILNIPTYQKMYIYNQTTNGYYNIGVEGDEKTHIQDDIVILHWDGIQYRYIPVSRAAK